MTDLDNNTPGDGDAGIKGSSTHRECSTQTAGFEEVKELSSRMGDSGLCPDRQAARHCSMRVRGALCGAWEGALWGGGDEEAGRKRPQRLE